MDEALCANLTRGPDGLLDPVHEHADGTWWFYEETWADENGPYENELLARLKIREYVDQL